MNPTSCCDTKGDRRALVARIQVALAERHVVSHLFDRRSGLVGPPFLRDCDPPLVAGREGDDGRHGYATIYVCQSKVNARSVNVPELPGQRFRHGPVIAVVAADRSLARDVQAAIRRRD